jgi:hypothetical protein
MYDGSQLLIVRNLLTGVTISTVTRRPATWDGLCRVWWPAAASGVLTLLAIATALTRPGRSAVAAIRIPRMTTRRWLIVVAVLGTEGGLIVNTLRSSGVDPMHARWTPILIRLALLHVVAFMPVGVVVLYRSSSGPTSVAGRLAMRLPRMTMRRWMIAVVVLALAGGWRAWWAKCQAIAAYHHAQSDGVLVSGPRERIASITAQLRWHVEMERKYRRAAWLPWFATEPDPPRPE